MECDNTCYYFGSSSLFTRYSIEKSRYIFGVYEQRVYIEFWDMDRRNNNNNNRPSVAAAATTVAIGAAVGYGAYKLFESFFGSNEPQQNQPNRNDDQILYQRPQQISRNQFGEIYVVNTVEECRYSMRQLKTHCDEYNVLGFDCEWVSHQGIGRSPVALLQLSTHRGLCVLIRLWKLRYTPPELEEILEDSDIVKVGVAPYTDAKYLKDDYGVHVASTLDLRFMATAARCTPGGLKKMAKDYLGIPLDKSTQCSDWEAPTLSRPQIEYAALDVHVAIQLFKYFAREIAPGQNSKDIIDHLSRYINQNYGPQRNWVELN
ncbi:exonuclease 3'-5' domain-containing protein 2-like [Sitodiplosis mosellana]|uniref:exonuclease 3'-5' domain-containing protein 2-like n=1 Tax=Sitodiplosis mosellana TaxID=263140 RepID=UPI002444381D|nr:exonuclease 3'-5' domain-containing protein 2-like [Sitodiplosis mosellana]